MTLWEQPWLFLKHFIYQPGLSTDVSLGYWHGDCHQHSRSADISGCWLCHLDSRRFRDPHLLPSKWDDEGCSGIRVLRCGFSSWRCHLFLYPTFSNQEPIREGSLPRLPPFICSPRVQRVSNSRPRVIPQANHSTESIKLAASSARL